MNEPTKLQQLVSQISGKSISEYIGVYKQIPFRVELQHFARLSALHEIQNSHSKVPRNALLNDLLSIAMDEVISQLDPDVLQHLQAIESEYLDNLSQLDSGDLADD